MHQRNSISALVISTIFVLTVFITACSAQQTEEQALQSLREMTKDGKLPPESVVANVESRFAGKRTGALAKLLRGRIRFENNDFAGAEAILNSNDFQTKTNLGDYALWLRGKSLQGAGNHAEAMNVFEKLFSDYPDSLRIRDAKLRFVESASKALIVSKASATLWEMVAKNDVGALLLVAKTAETDGKTDLAIQYYRRTYFYGAGNDAAKEAEVRLIALSQILAPQTVEEASVRAQNLFLAKNYNAAEKAYTDLVTSFPGFASPETQLKRLTVLATNKKMPEALNAFNSISASATEKEAAYYQLITGYAKARLWPNARQAAEEMRQKFPNGKLTPKAWVDAGMAARDAKNKPEELYFLRAALAAFPNAVEVAGAQFELAWIEHESKNVAKSSQMLIEHLARYAEKDTTNRGKAGYWAARDSEKAGKIAEACALYEGVTYRYSANWYGYLGLEKLTSLKGRGQCTSLQTFPAGSLVPKAVANLKTVTVAAETSTSKELERAEKSEQLSIIGLFDWAIDELEEAKKTAQNSPKINLALAKHYRLKGSNVSALLALAKSYPDYAQMFPEEMGREEWDIFYPLTNWDQITAWAKNRNLDKYQVAGLIRQESVFDPKARSGAKAYGLMQLLLPTAKLVARSFGSTANLASAESLYQPALNIELGTGYMRQQLDKFGRIEYMAVAYNAGPGRVNQWRPTLPADMDEFVEAIPFKETKGYVQGIIRNSAQYRRLYDENGNFKPNVGTKPLRGEIDSKTRDQIAAEFPEVIVEDRKVSE